VEDDGGMIDHLGINCADLEAAKAFYDAVLAPLGFSRQLDFGVAVGYGTEGKPDFWIGTFDGVGPNREAHIAFTAADAERVRAFHAAAVALGAESLHEPRLHPEYHDRYYGAFVRDPDGNNVEAVCHTGE
jgi:catechol 2,3-dioxygenase-like lactoylglutathione lyase family enzyme